MRRSIASAFARWGAFAARRPWPIIAVVLLAVGALAAQTPKIVLDTTTEGFLHPDDPILLAYDDFRARFGRDDYVVIAVETSDVFTDAFLRRLENLHGDLATEVPYVDEVTSLLNARWTRGEADQLIVEDLVAEWPTSAADLDRLRTRVFSNPLYVDSLVSSDAKMTVVQVHLDTYVQEGVDERGKPLLRYLNGDETRAVVDAVAAALGRHDAPDFSLHASGSPWLVDRLAYYTEHDFSRLVFVCVGVIGVILYVMFGALRAVFLPLAIVLLTVVATLGLMPLLGIVYQTPTQIVPITLLAIGIGDSVHILSMYYQSRRCGHDQASALAEAFGHTGLAVVMTSITTAAAMMSFLTAELAPIANIGVLSPIGVMIALLLTLTLLPAVIAVLPEDAPPPARQSLELLLRIVVAAGTKAAKHPTPVLTVAAVVCLTFAIGTTKIRFSHNPLRWFPASDVFREATEKINSTLGGAMSIEVLFDTGRKGGVQEPEFLQALEDVAVGSRKHAGEVPALVDGGGELRVSGVISVVDILKEINRALGDNAAEKYVVPDSRAMIAQELLLFEMSGSDDLEDLTDYEYSVARMTMRTPWTDAVLYGDFIDGLLAEQAKRMGPDVQLTSTGHVPLITRTLTAVIHSMARSYVLAFIAVTPLMIMLLGRVRLGLLAMIPNLFPLVATLGLMGWVGMPLDLFSLLSGSIVLGLAVDDTIHFMNGFARDFSITRDVGRSVRATLETTGQAMCFTTLILCGGFATFAFAYLRNGVIFGTLTAFALATALLADVVLSPALVAVAPWKPVERAADDA